MIELSEIKDTKPKRNHGNIKALAESIKKEGLLQPLVINQNNELVCGRRRYEALNLLGWKNVPIIKIETETDVDKLSKSIAENLIRLNLTWQEEIKAKEELDQLMREKYGSQPIGKPKKTKLLNSSKFDELAWSQEKTAKLIGQPRSLITEDIQLSQALKKYPELEKQSTKSGAKRIFKRIKDKERIEKEAPQKKLEDKFKTILIDPPWDYGQLSVAGRGWTEYSVMSLDELKILPFLNYIDKEAHLYFWTTNNFLYKALKLAEIWGFAYKIILTWIKPSFGLGTYFRN